jgi:hypothetical protein
MRVDDVAGTICLSLSGGASGRADGGMAALRRRRRTGVGNMATHHWHREAATSTVYRRRRRRRRELIRCQRLLGGGGGGSSGVPVARGKLRYFRRQRRVRPPAAPHLRMLRPPAAAGVGRLPRGWRFRCRPDVRTGGVSATRSRDCLLIVHGQGGRYVECVRIQRYKVHYEQAVRLS